MPDATLDDAAPEAGSDRELRLAALLEQLLQSQRAGEVISIEHAAEAHPDLATDLRELWGAAALAEEFGSVHKPGSGEGKAVGRPGFSLPADALRGQGMGDYELLEELGRGGMGVVYRARQKSLGRVVALKMVLRGPTATQADLVRFRGEAESAARLRHPHIVPVFEVGEHDGLPFFSMQYVEGSSLAQRLAEGPLPGKEAARLLAPVARAIAEAHRQGVLHRDLKPSNVLIDVEGRPYVSDFGLAKQISPTVPSEADPTHFGGVTQTGAILGTPGYMSPEQAAGSRGELGPATDIHSLGAILYAMLTGRPPFQAPSPIETVLMVLEQDPVPPRLLNPRADRDLEMIALKCLQKPVELRYRQASDLADDLEAYLANEPIAARSSHIAQVLTRVFRESHHASILENWGLLWILHSAVLLMLCLITNTLHLQGVSSRWPYLGLWTVGLGLWAMVFWGLRRRAGPITFVERQIAHLWAGSMITDTLLYAIEYQLDLPVLSLSPVIGVVSGQVFLVKAAMLSGMFYVHAVALFATGLAMAWFQRQDVLPDFGITLFGIVSALCFLLPGLKYYRQSRRQRMA